MSMTERTRITEFNILPDARIAVRKTTEILRGEEVISAEHWRVVLNPNDEQAEAVLTEPFYLALAQAAWAQAAA